MKDESNAGNPDCVSSFRLHPCCHLCYRRWDHLGRAGWVAKMRPMTRRPAKPRGTQKTTEQRARPPRRSPKAAGANGDGAVTPPPSNPLDIVIIGLTITSSWGNGHATTYRGLVRELSRR